ncbi:MAG TPA: hypothetical protein VFS00_04940 [Polyangiaceae bacterium]|nr:hypothetical protein [Polyangiaceae bacterium]
MTGARPLRRRLAQAAALAGALAPFAGSPYLRGAPPRPPAGTDAGPHELAPDPGTTPPAPDASALAPPRRRGC